MGETIVALASASGTGALSIIRASGFSCFDIVRKVIEQKKRFESAAYKEIALYRIVKKGGNIIDEVTAIKYQKPQSYTGEDMVEIFCHGGTIISEMILEELIEAGARYAEGGEFTRRAFCNNKMNAIRAEAIRELITSKSKESHKAVINAYTGKSSEKLQQWRECIEESLMKLEAIIEFGDESDDVEQQEIQRDIKKSIKSVVNEIAKELQKREIIEQLEEEISIAIVGPPNAGKSSLLNELVGYARAIVHKKSGTTRDIISERIRIEKCSARLMDTAGLCEGEEYVEKEGVKKAWECLKSAQIVIWVTAATDSLKKEEEVLMKTKEKKRIIAFLNKTDLAENREKEALFKKQDIQWIKGSILNGDGETILLAIAQKVQELYPEGSREAVIISKRQKALMKETEELLSPIAKGEIVEEEICSQRCRDALKALGEFCGEINSETLLDRIFENFCIGK